MRKKRLLLFSLQVLSAVKKLKNIQPIWFCRVTKLTIRLEKHELGCLLYV